MKLVRFLCGLGAGVFALTLTVLTPYTLATKSGVNLAIIDSQVDQLFYMLMMLGGAGMFTAISVSLLRTALAKDRTVTSFALISGLFFFSGLYYHMIFGSPW